MYGYCVSRKWARTVSAPLSCCLDVPTRDYAGTGLASTRAMRRTQPAAIGCRGRHVGHTGGISHNGYAVYNAVSKGVVCAVCSWPCISLHTPLVQHGCAELWNVIRFIEKKSAPLNAVWRKRFRLVAVHFKKNKQEQSRAGLPVPDHARLCIFTPLPRPPRPPGTRPPLMSTVGIQKRLGPDCLKGEAAPLRIAHVRPRFRSAPQTPGVRQLQRVRYVFLFLPTKAGGLHQHRHDQPDGPWIC